MANATSDDERRASQLAETATDLITSGQLEPASRTLREASSLSSQNAAVRAAWDRLKEEEAQAPVIRLFKSWVVDHDQRTATEALQYLSRPHLARESAEEATKLLMQTKHMGDDASEMADRLMAALLLRHQGARHHLAMQVREQPTATFGRLFERGDGSIDGLLATLLDAAAWPSREALVEAQRDAFMLALAAMMQAGQDHPERAMKIISRLLAAEAGNLKGIIDSDSFDVILAALDLRAPKVLRSQATLATAKIMELSPDVAQTLITQFVTSRVAKPTTDDLIIAFSAAGAIFPLAPNVGATLFLTNGFVPSFVSLVEGKQSQRLEQAALELLNAACVDKPCREAIGKHCRAWLQGLVDISPLKRRSNSAALVLMKISESAVDDRGSKVQDLSDSTSQEQLLEHFKQEIISDDQESRHDAMQGIGYAALKPRIKEELADDREFLTILVQCLEQSMADGPLLYGGITILHLLCSYLPNKSDEQKHMAKLKAYASASKSTEPDPLDNDAHVTARCKKVLDVGVVPVLVRGSKNASAGTLALITSILLSLSKEKQHRGILAQQGAVKLLIQIYETAISSTSSSASASKDTSAQLIGTPTPRAASHALARILISVNPHHVFTTASALSASSAIRPLVSLLPSTQASASPLTESSTTRDLLPTFESLLALTNLASTADPTIDAIAARAFPALDGLLLHSTPLIQRAATELLCNLSASPRAAAPRFTDGSRDARQRLHVLLALADVPDEPTRRAAGGALAMLTAWEGVVAGAVARERGVKVLVDMAGAEEGEDVRHRGVVCLRNMAGAEGDVGKRAREAIREEGGVEVLREMAKTNRAGEVVEVATEALKLLDGNDGGKD